MGWGRMMLLGNVGQQLDIQDNERALGEISEQLRSLGQAEGDTASQLSRLNAENGELKLYLAAIVRLLVSKNVVTPYELKQIVDLVDRSDGRPDGKFTGEISPP